MRAPRSLRLRFVLGSILWTGGLLMIAHLLMMVVLPHFRFFHFLPHSLFHLAGLALMATGFWLIRGGLLPIRQLRARLADLRAGASRQLEGSYPSEIAPLVADLNALLAQREKTVERALAKAGDLAHGLKTPLTLLAQEADRAEAAGHAELAANLRQQVDRMRRQVDYQLAQARAAAAGSEFARTPVAPCLEALARTLTRLHAGRDLELLLDVPPNATFRGQREDLEEILGNLLDNACQWAKTRVEVRAVAVHDRLEIQIEDDGPGLDPTLRQKVLERGVRADQAAPGSGLGLAIVRDLTELYGGSVQLDTASLGGLRVVLVLPGA
jgi:signal transduction histidine kinase